MRGSSTGIRRIATATLAMAALGWTAALAEERVALLIGNERYASAQLSNLSNPANDARALEPVLARLGFATDVLVDADRAAAEAALHEFSADAAGAEVALFFFSGHAVQIEGTNRLLTAGFSQRIEPESGTEKFLAEVERETLDLDTVREALAAAAPDLGLIVLDSCRDNPFIDSGLAVRGLARAPGRSRLLIAFATDPGNVAYDGGGANSPFTAALLDHIATPGLEVRLMFGRVRQDVVRATGGRQVPWVEEAVLEEHFLNPAPPAAETEPQLGAEVALWLEATRDGSDEAYARYLAAYPDGLFQVVAAERRDRPAVTSAVPALADVPPGADRETLVAALTTLGFLPQARGLPEEEELGAAFASYVRQVGGESLEALYLDASQVALMLGAATGQSIRLELAALGPMETALERAERTRADLAGLAAEYPEDAEAVQAALERADTDIAVMQERLAYVRARLDEDRTHYAELVERASRHFRPYLARALPGALDRTRGGAAAQTRSAEDARRFLEHATSDGVARTEGSYAWLTDFLPRN